MNMQTDKDKRDLLSGLRFCLQALEGPGAMTLTMQGKDAARDTAERLRREIAYLEAVLTPEGAAEASAT
jgi:hypothetical protein